MEEMKNIIDGLGSICKFQQLYLQLFTSLDIIPFMRWG